MIAEKSAPSELGSIVLVAVQLVCSLPVDHPRAPWGATLGVLDALVGPLNCLLSAAYMAARVPAAQRVLLRVGRDHGTACIHGHGRARAWTALYAALVSRAVIAGDVDRVVRAQSVLAEMEFTIVLAPLGPVDALYEAATGRGV